jgi:hypothetical protein
VSEEAKESPTLKDSGVSKSSSGCGKMILSPLMAGEEVITSEEADLAKVAAPAPLEISEGVSGVEEEENNVTSNTTRQPSMFDPVKDDLPICHALQLCCTPNATNEELVICINCNCQAHKICTQQLSFQQPVDDNFVITLKDFSKMGKEQLKKTLVLEKQNVVFCLLCKAEMLQVKVHGSKVQSIKNTRHKKTKMSTPSAVILRGLRRFAAYHCQA